MMLNIFKATAKSQSKNYMPEVDGLRAIAVILVLIFHLNPTGYYKGGFIGVDVFFVISGFLITSIIYNQTCTNRFSYFRFMEQRIARLYPALLVTTLFVLIAGFLFYVSSYYLITGDTVKYVLFSISNFFFAKQSGYWDVSSINNPFLHTWSLGIEQQFYLIWPFIIIFGLFLFKKTYSLLVFVFIICIASLIFAQYLSVHYPVVNFYAPSSRIFELGMGGLWAIVYTQNKDRLNNIRNLYKEILFAVGIALILILGHRYKEGISSFPGYNTICIVIASILCIYAGQASYLGLITRNKLCVGIGLISYSVYLTHWPLIVFYRVLNQSNDIDTKGQLFLFVLSLAIGFLMYVFIENRYRKISISIFTKSGKFFIASFIVLLVISFMIVCTKGLPWRIENFPQEFVEQSSYTKVPDEFKDEVKKYSIIILGDKSQEPKAIFIGDSFLQQYFVEIDSFFKKRNMSVYYSSEGACIFLDNILHKKADYKQCKTKTEELYKLINEKNLPIIKINHWSYHLTEKNSILMSNLATPASNDLIFEKIKQQQLLSKKNMLLIVSQPYIGRVFNPEGLPLIYFKYNENLSSSEKSTLKYFKFLNNKLIKSVQSKNISFIDIYPIFCHSDDCKLKDTKNGYLYYSYDGHLSKYGAHIVWNKISDQIYQFIMNNQ